ncbi:hypothetical protein PILCRDRAFT_827106 [Piloderma croceum F 1598]|uniref:Uncharacterized protein n=1 Tax=Piloderma croceum (strain F 1598) TaxID=765440 RepID=A0A0C3F6H4_PILCF|nr:hypothetical protein PILCRDRAFT_827106 [Piloderma croceum F 1598]
MKHQNYDGDTSNHTDSYLCTGCVNEGALSAPADKYEEWKKLRFVYPRFSPSFENTNIYLTYKSKYITSLGTQPDVREMVLHNLN